MGFNARVGICSCMASLTALPMFALLSQVECKNTQKYRQLHSSEELREILGTDRAAPYSWV